MEEELFSIVRESYGNVNKEYLTEQVKAALRVPSMSKEDTLKGLLDWIIEAGCSGMNEHYRNFVYSAIGHLQN